MLSNQEFVSIAVLVSGNGTNLQALIDAQLRGELKKGRIIKVVSSRAGVYALNRAKNANIESEVVEKISFKTNDDFDRALLSVLQQCGAELVILAGFMSILGDEVLSNYKDRIINVHPSLIPAFCGKGYYGLKVHEEALKRGVKITGATVHFVNEIPDGGKILFQKAVEVRIDDTPERLQKRVMEEAEWVILPKAAGLVSDLIYNERSLNN